MCRRAATSSKGSAEERELGSPGTVRLLQEPLPGHQEIQEPEGHDQFGLCAAEETSEEVGEPEDVSGQGEVEEIVDRSQQQEEVQPGGPTQHGVSILKVSLIGIVVQLS